jgi:hypothetical protein
MSDGVLPYELHHVEPPALEVRVEALEKIIEQQ